MQENLFKDVVPGMTVKVHQKIKELNPKGEEKERIQIFEGIVISRKGGERTGATVTVRKISNGIGVEKIFPVNLPSITKIERIKQADVRRAKLYYLRTHKKRLKEKTLV
jgi:large subunit ribosomal protein L19